MEDASVECVCAACKNAVFGVDFFGDVVADEPEGCVAEGGGVVEGEDEAVVCVFKVFDAGKQGVLAVFEGDDIVFDEVE